MTAYTDLVAALLVNPPDPNEPLPLTNQRRTILGTILTFLILSWAAVLFRLWVRLRVVREPGWDDFFVMLAALCNTTAIICICLSIEQGLGRHMLYVGMPKLNKYFFLFYIETSIYLTETTFIKVSLLLQYLRIFKSGMMRKISIVLLVIVSVWGLGFFIIGWFPCFPVKASWDRRVPAKCYGFGFHDVKSFTGVYKAHSASNMALDLAIFLTPLMLFNAPNLRAKNAIAMGGIFTFGAVVVSTSVWRLYAIAVTQAGTYPYIDFTWWAPIMIILSVLEISLAIICASMPIFWPVVEKSLAAIFVSFEVEIVEERVEAANSTYQLQEVESRKDSIKTPGAESIRELVRDEESGWGHLGEYSLGAGDPMADAESSVQTNIGSKPKPKWEM